MEHLELVAFILFSLYVLAIILNIKTKYDRQCEAKKNCDVARFSLYKKVEDVLGARDLDRLKHRKIWIGMPKCLLRYAWGEPHKTSKIVNATEVSEVWHFGAMPYKQDKETKYEYKHRVHILNLFVTQFEKL